MGVRQVIEWTHFDDGRPEPGVRCLFTSESTGETLLGFLVKLNDGNVGIACRGPQGKQYVVERHVECYITHWSPIEDDIIMKELKAQESHLKLMQDEYGPAPGSAEIFDRVNSRKMTREEFRNLDAKIINAHEQGMKLRVFLQLNNIRVGSRMYRVVNEIWKLRYSRERK